jgi:hypothetical protein
VAVRASFRSVDNTPVTAEADSAKLIPESEIVHVPDRKRYCLAEIESVLPQ